MNTCVLCLSRLNALECTIRSRSRWKGVRCGESSSGRSRRAGYERAACGERCCASSRSIRSRKGPMAVSAVRGMPGPILSAAGDAIEGLLPRECRLCGSDPGDRHAVGRAAHVVEPGHLEVSDRVGVAAVLAADPELELGLGLAADPGGQPHQPAHSEPVDRLERTAVEDPALHVAVEEAALDVVAREA